jgi:hypothetical protein
VRGGNTNPVTAANLKKMLNALSDVRLATIAYGILSYDAVYEAWLATNRQRAQAN